MGEVEPHAGTSLALVVPGRPGIGGRVDAGPVLRALLGKVTGRPPESIRLEKSAAGKPWLEGSGVAFNLSHARGYSLIALSLAADIGCDIEDRFGQDDVMELGAGVLHASELDALQRLGAHERQDAFRRYWVRKEAVLKAAGTGFLRDPRLVVTGLDEPHATWIGEPGPALTLHDRQIAPGCVAAVASVDAACSWHRLIG